MALCGDLEQSAQTTVLSFQSSCLDRYRAFKERTNCLGRGRKSNYGVKDCICNRRQSLLLLSFSNYDRLEMLPKELCCILYNQTFEMVSPLSTKPLKMYSADWRSRERVNFLFKLFPLLTQEPSF